jgi:hypothetical protein
MSTLLESIKQSLALHIPKELVDKLAIHYSDINSHFRLNKHENSELNASKFSEIVFRIIEFSLTGKYTPLDKQIQKFSEQCRAFEQAPSAGVDDSLRIHIPRTLILIVDIRNKRGVGHVSGIHNPNLLDSTFVVTSADWIFAELLRIIGKLPIDEAQIIVDQLIQIRSPFVVEIEGATRVLKTSLGYKEQVLIILHSKYPTKINNRKLFTDTEYSRFSDFCSKVLKPLHKKRLIEYDAKGDCHLLPPGISEAERILFHS